MTPRNDGAFQPTAIGGEVITAAIRFRYKTIAAISGT